jgi:hypothetical protein
LREKSDRTRYGLESLILNDLPRLNQCRFIVPEINLKPDTIGTLDDGFDRRFLDTSTR